MRPRSSLLIEVEQIDRTKLEGALETLSSCWKSSSILWMHANDFPVLSGLIVKGWTKAAETALLEFSQRKKVSNILLRIEKPGQRWTRRRGGYTLPTSSVGALVGELADEGMLALLLEPASPYSDLYSLASICDLEARRFDVEVVGPGFDASDMLRSDLMPHERFEVASISASSSRTKFDHVTRTYLIGPEAYRASVLRRLAKIGARLRNPSFPDEELRASDVEILKAEAVRFLRESGQTTLLDRLEEYEPISPAILEAFLAQVRRLSSAAIGAHVPWKALSVAGSFLQSGQLVLWDFFPPEGGETVLLPSMVAAN